jgi:hypothetical protein
MEFLFFTSGKDFEAPELWARSIGYSIPLYRHMGGPGLEIRRIPRTMILDRNGVVAASTGPEVWNYWSESIRNLIGMSAMTNRRPMSLHGDGVRIAVEVVDGKPNSNLHLSPVDEKGVKLSAIGG